MSEEETVIKVEHVFKDFKLPHEKASSLKSIFTHATKYIRKNRKFENQHALHDISFEVKKGEFFGIVGRNGSGKSTLLKILAGIYQPNKGKVKVDGRLVPFIELGVGFNGELTGRENVYLNGALLGFSREEMDKRYNDIVEFAELERFMDQKLKNYSSGMQVRLAFSVAIRADAEILLVDEVLAVGDADFQRKCFNHFQKLKKEHQTVVFVSHDMSAIREYCDRVILIEKSEIVKKGTATAIATAYTRMFTPDHRVREVGGTNRWGDNAMVQRKVRVTPTTCDETVKDLKITVDFEAKEKVHNPVFGFLIKNAGGTEIVGTNNKLQHVMTGTFEPGQKGQIEWSVPNVFNDGEYFVNAAISHEDAVTQHDWWEDAERFTVYKENRTPYVVNPFIELKIKSN